MPERTILYCDAPGCEEEGTYETVTVDGKSYDVILGPKHKQVLRELAGWGRPSPQTRSGTVRRSRRDTDPRRLMSLLDADRRHD